MRLKPQSSRALGARRILTAVFCMICCVRLMAPSVCGQQGKSLAVQAAAIASVLDDRNPNWRTIAQRGEHLLFAARVRNYTQCLLDWAVRSARLSGHQRRVLMMNLDTREDELVRERQRYDSGPYAGSLPIQFAVVATEIDGAFGRLLNETDVLLPAQRRQLLTALQDKSRQRQRDNLKGIVCRIDRELFLTADQRALIRDEAGRCLDLNNGGFDFPFDPSGRHARWSAAVQRLTPLLTQSQLAKTWSESQQAAVDMLIDERPRRLLRLDPEDSAVTPQDVLDERLALGRRRCLRVAQMQLDLYRREGLIDRAQAGRLDVQARSRVEQYLTRWRRPVLARLKFFAGSGTETHWFEDALPKLTGVTSSAAWQTHLQLEIPKLVDFAERRRAVSGKRLAHYMTGLLDRELWLTSVQRDKMMRHLEIAMPDHWLEPTSEEMLFADWSLATIAAAVALLDKTEFAEFHDNQWRAFWGVKRLVSGGDSRFIESPQVSGTGTLTITNGYFHSRQGD